MNQGKLCAWELLRIVDLLRLEKTFKMEFNCNSTIVTTKLYL